MSGILSGSRATYLDSAFEQLETLRREMVPNFGKPIHQILPLSMYKPKIGRDW